MKLIMKSILFMLALTAMLSNALALTPPLMLTDADVTVVKSVAGAVINSDQQSICDFRSSE